MDQAVQELGRRVDSLARDRARMEAILSSMIEGVLVVDEQGRLQLVNDAARRILKLEQGAINHSYVEAIRHPGIVEHLGRALAGGETSALELSVTRDTTRTLVAQVAPVVTAGRGAVLVMHDITELRKADLIRRDFVANVSHELRTPLTAIKGYAEALLDDPDDAEARERFLEIIHRQAERMERLVKDLLRLARLEAGQETVEVAPCDITALVRGIVADFEPTATAKQQTHRRSRCRPRRRCCRPMPRSCTTSSATWSRTPSTTRPTAAPSTSTRDGRGRTLPAERGRHRSRHCARRPRPRLRTLLPRRQVADAARRHRARPVDCQTPGPGARR